MNQNIIAQKASVAALILLISYIIADFGVLWVRSDMYPQPVPPATRAVQPSMASTGGNYSVITSRNIFNADQKIAARLGQGEQAPSAQPDNDPVPSDLPIQLMGTIVHADPKRSVATLNLRNKNEQVPVKVDKVIPDNLATVVKIERNKIIFRNNSMRRLEFVEMKDDAKLAFGAPSGKPQQVGEVLKRSETEFELKRDDINRLTNNLPELLQQARAVPRMGPNGQIECFSLADIQAGSIYERLGLRRGDCIKSVNGEKIDSPAKAMELYNALRANSNAINLGVERDGRDNMMNYNIQ